METKTPNKQLLEKVNKIIERKNLIRAFVRGEITLDQLNERGIKLAMPL